MGLFDTKYCDVCGEKIGLLGSRKLDDGVICKKCAAKLSPFFTGRKRSSLADIKEQLKYREANEVALNDFHPTKVYGNNMKIYVDEEQKKFIVTRAKDWHKDNPDIINMDRVVDVKVDVQEHADEIYWKDKEGKEQSYNPKRYDFEYEFKISLSVDHPYFSEIEFELSDERPKSPYAFEYHQLEKQAYEIIQAFDKDRQYQEYKPENSQYVDYDNQYTNNNNNTNDNNTNTLLHIIDTVVTSVTGNNTTTNENEQWFCPNCGTPNTGKFCQTCGTPRPAQQSGFCPNCGKKVENPNAKFCPNCGKQLY